MNESYKLKTREKFNLDLSKCLNFNYNSVTKLLFLIFGNLLFTVKKTNRKNFNQLVIYVFVTPIQLSSIFKAKEKNS